MSRECRHRNRGYIAFLRHESGVSCAIPCAKQRAREQEDGNRGEGETRPQEQPGKRFDPGCRLLPSVAAIDSPPDILLESGWQSRFRPRLSQEGAKPVPARWLIQ
jgi:hypothetical protein